MKLQLAVNYESGRAALPAKDPSVASRIVEVLVAHGIKRVFGIPGGAISPVTNALLDFDIEHVTCQHECMAVYAAIGHSRATGLPGVVMVTSGPGVLNTVTGLAAAYQDEAPLLLLVGDVASDREGRGVLQDGSAKGLHVEQVVASVTKLSASLHQPLRVEALLERAFAVAMERPQGPAVLRLPIDLTNASAPAEVVEQAITAAVAPDNAFCRRLAHELGSARRPALFIGGAARWSKASRAIVDLAEWTRCPVISDLEAKGVFPETHPLSLGLFGVGGGGRAAAYLSEGVDLLLTVGARLDDTTTGNFSPLLQPQGVLAQLDHDPRRLARSYKPDLMMSCDIPLAVKRIRSLVPAPPGALLLARDQALRAVPRPAVSEARLGAAPHDPRVVIAALQRAFRDDTVYSCDIGNHLLFAGRHLVLDRPDQFHVSIGLGGMTSGIGTAAGLQFAYGHRRRVVGICGDGGLLMGGNELGTCVRYGVPLTLAVFTDGQLGMVRHGSKSVYGRSHDWRVPATDQVAYARALGAEAWRVEGEDDLARAARYRGKKPLLLDIPVDSSVCPANPRDDGLNFVGEKR